LPRPYPDADDEALPVPANRDWHKSLYLHPGEWIAWVILVLMAVVAILLGVIYLLHSHEKAIRGHGQCFVVGIGIWRDDHDLTIWNDTFDVGVVFFIVDAGSNEEILRHRTAILDLEE
jgi:hypothetical protein